LIIRILVPAGVVSRSMILWRVSAIASGRAEEPRRPWSQPTSADVARAYARDRSTDFRVLASSVTRFTIGSLGIRHPVAWFVDGKEQPQREPRPGSFYPTDGGPVLRSI